jgi:hypothetical protein
MMMMMSNPPLNPETLDPMVLANGAMEQCFPLIAGSAMTDEFKDLTTNLVFEFAKIAGQLIQQEPFFQPPESPAPIHFTHAMCEQTVTLFVDGLIHAAIHGWQQGIPNEPLSQILQTLAQDLFFQTKQMVASTIAMEGLPEELQQTLAPEQMQAIAHQTAVNGLEYFTQQFEDQVGPIERQYPEGTLTEEMPQSIALDTLAPEETYPSNDTLIEASTEEAYPTPNELPETSPPLLSTQDVLNDSPEGNTSEMAQGMFQEDMPHELPETPPSNSSWEEDNNPEAAFQNLESQQETPTSSSQHKHAPHVQEATVHHSVVKVTPTEAPPETYTSHTMEESQALEDPLALESVSPELLAALALYAKASHTPPGETNRLHALCPQITSEEWHQVATYKTLDPDVLLRSESGLKLKLVKHYLLKVQHQMVQLVNAQAQGNWGEQTARLAQLQERKAGIKWAHQMKLLFQHYAQDTHKLIPLIQQERERVQQVLAEGLYAISVDSPIQWKDIPAKTREGLFEYFQEKLYMLHEQSHGSHRPS